MTITGLSEAKLRLESLDTKMQKTIMRKGVRAGCKILLKAARREAPIYSGPDKHIEPGKIRKNLKITTQKKKSKGKFALFVENTTDMKRVPPGIPVDLGHIARGSLSQQAARVHRRRSLGDKMQPPDGRKFIAANPFMGRAYDSVHSQAAQVCADSILEQVGKEGPE